MAVVFKKTDMLIKFYKSIADETRLKILCILDSVESMCVCDIAEILSMTPSAISHQLRLLKQARLVKSRRDGKTIYYSLADSHVRAIIDQGLEHVLE